MEVFSKSSTSPFYPLEARKVFSLPRGLSTTNPLVLSFISSFVSEREMYSSPPLSVEVRAGLPLSFGKMTSND